MYPHHAETVARLVARWQHDPTVLALIIVGSVARGDARPDSDVDCYLVVTDAAYQARAARGDLTFAADDLCSYPDGQAGGSVVDLAFLEDAAARGPEPARYAFTTAILALSRVPGLADLLAQIPRYPEAERLEKMRSFAAQLPVHFGMLYPNRKWFLREVARAPARPAAFLDLATALLTRPAIATAAAFCDCVTGFQAWPQPPEGAMVRFQHDRELLWRRGPAPLADR